MKTNPHITITGNVNTFDINECSFTMTPTPYAILTRSNSPFPIKAHFADSGLKKRWGNDGPKVIVGSTITIEGSIQRVTRDHSNERIFQFAQIEVTNITYLGSVHANPAGSTSSTTFSSYSSQMFNLPKQTTAVPKLANAGIGTTSTARLTTKQALPLLKHKL